MLDLPRAFQQHLRLLERLLALGVFDPRVEIPYFVVIPSLMIATKHGTGSISVISEVS